MKKMFAGFSFRGGQNRNGRTKLQFAHETLLRDFVFRGDTVIDVGTALADNAVFLASLVGPRGTVHAFESNPVLIPLALGHLLSNGITQCRLSNAFVCEQQGQFVTQVIAGKYRVSIHQAFRPRVAQSSRTSIEVQTVSLDRYCSSNRIRPSLVLIAAGSAAAAVIEGSRQLLRQQMPVVVVSGSRRTPSPAAELFARLTDLGYMLYDGYSYAPPGKSPEGEEAGTGMLVVAVPQAFRRAHGRRWRRPPTTREHMTASLEPEVPASHSDVLASSFFLLSEGRWILQCNTSVSGFGRVGMKIVDDSGCRRAALRLPIHPSTSPFCSGLVLDLDAVGAFKIRVAAIDRDVRLHVGNLSIREVTF